MKNEFNYDKIMEELCRETIAEAALCSAVEMCQECGITMTDAVKKIIRKFNLSEDDATSKVKEFWVI